MRVVKEKGIRPEFWKLPPVTCEVEVTLGQAACILNVATERSLVIVDELGKDTKTLDIADKSPRLHWPGAV